MNRTLRIFLAVALIAGISVTLRAIPWQSAYQSIGESLDDRPPWVPADGRSWPIKMFPELFTVLGNKFGGDGRATFAMPNEAAVDILSNAQFGSVVLYRCIATRDLRDLTTVGSIAWCDRPLDLQPPPESHL